MSSSVDAVAAFLELDAEARGVMAGELDECAYRRVLPSGDVVEVWRQLYNSRVTITDKSNDGICFREGYCYKDRARALEAAAAWDGEDEPEGWNKNLQTGEWRP